MEDRFSKPFHSSSAHLFLPFCNGKMLLCQTRGEFKGTVQRCCSPGSSFKEILRRVFHMVTYHKAKGENQNSTTWTAVKRKSPDLGVQRNSLNFTAQRAWPTNRSEIGQAHFVCPKPSLQCQSLRAGTSTLGIQDEPELWVFKIWLESQWQQRLISEK